MKTESARDWIEDFSHENGNYLNTCIECRQVFKGHKRRVICKLCSVPDWEKLAAMPAPEDNKHAHAGCWGEGRMVGYAQCMMDRVIPSDLQIAKLRIEIQELRKELEIYKLLKD